MKQEKRIPTIVGVVILFIGVVAGVFLSARKTSFFTKASGDCRPVNPQITNITYNSATASFLTTAVCSSVISINGKTISDVRYEKQGKDALPSQVHYFQIENLNESSEYNYSFILNGEEYTNDRYHFKTATKPQNTQIPLSNLAWGRVYTPELKPAPNSIVYLTIPGASPLSSFVTSNGHWNIPLATSFNTDLNSWFTPPANVDEEIVVLSSSYSATQITSNTNRNNPVPDIILGQNKFSSLPVTGQKGVLVVSPSDISKNLEIISPKEGENIHTKKPDIFGNSPASVEIKFSFNNNSITGSVVSKNDGTWHWTPPQELAPGEYILNASAVHPRIGVENVSRRFLVAADASNLAFSASQSASLISPTPIPLPSISPTIAPSPTAVLTPIITPKATVAINTKPSPTLKLTPTSKPTPTIRPTSTPRPTSVIVSNTKPSTSSGMPVAGSSAISVVLATISVIFVAASLMF